MLRSLCVSSLLCAASSFAQSPIRVGIVDTGLDLNDERFKQSLCKYGHRDFSGEGLEDTVGHGTHIASIIQSKLKGLEGKYCFVIIKYYNNNRNAIEPYVQAIQYAVNLNLEVVNASVSGNSPAVTRDGLNNEYKVYSSAKNTVFIVAAGNEGDDLDVDCNQYPVCYARALENVISVGSTESSKLKSPTSNYGYAVEEWKIGVNVNGYAIGSGTKRYSGTSQATAVHTGKYVRNRIVTGR